MSDRRARCTYFGSVAKYSNGQPCAAERPSSTDLAFFEDTSASSVQAALTCGQCRYHKVAHGEINDSTGRPGITDHEFVPHGAWEFDRFYCGCWGWD